MQRLEVSGAVRPIYGSLGVKRLNYDGTQSFMNTFAPSATGYREPNQYSHNVFLSVTF